MLLRDLLDLPDQVRKGDFVLNLAAGVTAHAQETVESYVPTPQLVKCFDEALGLVKSSLESNKSKAAYLHGSFGSGKSHFMAIMLLLLERNALARAIPELSEVVAKHNGWTESKRFLLVPYHMLGAEDMETAILGGYAAHVRKHHADKPTPAVYRSEALLEDARRLREQFGDTQFFAKLNEGRTGGDGWGDISEKWDVASFEQAATAQDSAEHRRLVGDLVDRYFTNVRENAHGFIDLDKGLSVISQHAKMLGYHGLILFLDELILWLASHAADINFLNREGTKLPKLVEAQHADRPAPIISFIARQRDLRELVGDHVAGSLQLGFSDILRFWEARFSTIKLEDRNLAAIAEKRVLKAKDGAARAAMDAEFSKTEKIREAVMNVLLTQSSNRDDFRKLYPFTPALVETLVALSSLLQRERTALKIMLQLLVDQKDRLQLGELVPVGDLFVAIADGDEAFNDVMKAHFENARKLWTQRLRPLLEQEHQLTHEQAETSALFRADARLLKTLLLAALAPEVESLKLMTASRLAALNHGSIKSPIAGQESGIVLNKMRRWAGQIGQIRISDDAGDPTIQIQLSDVDTEAILTKANAVDNPGERARKIKELLFAQMKIADQGELWVTQPFMWRGTKRMCEVLFTNVRETMDESLRTDGTDGWKVIVDYPFDTPPNTPAHDVARLCKFRDANSAQRTIVWIPSFFGLQAQRDLSAYVRLEHILTGDRFGQFVNHLSAQDQTAARTQLDNQRRQLQSRLILHLEAAYGIHPAEVGSLDTSHELETTDQFQSLHHELDLRPPVSANLRDAFVKLIEQAMAFQFPAHPAFDENANLGNASLKRVLAEIENAVRNDDGRVAIEQPMRAPMNQVAVPLKLGAMGQTHFKIGSDWQSHFDKEHAQAGGAITVGRLREWINKPKAMGLPIEAQNLLILAFAAQTNRSFYLHGTPITPALEKLENELELREEKLPANPAWKAALERAAHIFGFAASPLLNAGNLARFCADLRERACSASAGVDTLIKQLRSIPLEFIGGAATNSPRLNSAIEAAGLLKLIGQHEGSTLVEQFGGFALTSTPAAIGTSISSAGDVSSALQGMSWDILDGLHSATGDHAATAAKIFQNVSEFISNDEHVSPLQSRLLDAQKGAVSLLKAMATRPAPPVIAPTPVPVPVPTNVPPVPKDETEVVLFLPEECSAQLAKHRDVQIDISAGTLTIVATGRKFKLRLLSQQA